MLLNVPRIMDVANGDVVELMRDVNHFLSTTLHNESLSSKALAEKEELLKKMASFPEILTPYLDMSRSSKKCSAKIVAEYVPLNVSEDRVDSQLYEEFPDQTLCYSLPPEESQSGCIIEYLILPVSKLRGVAKKFGALWRKEKFMGLFGERTIRCWVGVLGDVLYIYGSDRDPKPDSFVNLIGFEARPAVSQYPKDVKKRHCCFELVCPGKKSLQFLASSVADMEQWISCINEVSNPSHNGHDNDMKKRQLPSPPPSNGPQEYDDIRALHSEVTNQNAQIGGKIYHNLKNLGIRDGGNADAPLQGVNCTKSTVNELVYDDICSVSSSLYYNVADQRTELRPGECDGRAFAYSDEEDIYDDIGLLSSAADAAVVSNFAASDLSRKGENASPKHCGVRENMCSLLGKSMLCADNLYEPVDNP